MAVQYFTEESVLKSYWVPLISGKKELSKENFREGWDKRGFTNKPRVALLAQDKGTKLFTG